MILEQKKAEHFLHENNAEVAFIIAGYVAEELIKQSLCESCKILLKAGDVDIANDACLNILFRGGLFVPAKLLANFVCSYSAILDFVEIEIVTLSSTCQNISSLCLASLWTRI